MRKQYHRNQTRGRSRKKSASAKQYIPVLGIAAFLILVIIISIIYTQMVIPAAAHDSAASISEQVQADIATPSELQEEIEKAFSAYKSADRAKY